MPMPEGTKKWSTLATWSNQQVYEYFQTVRGQSESHAFNSVRSLRRLFDSAGKRYKHEIDVPYDFWTPASGVPKAEPKPDLLKQISAAQCEECGDTSEIHYNHCSKFKGLPPTPETEADMGNDNAANALAAMIAPAMAGMVTAEIAKAVAKIHAETAPVKQLVVLKDKLETKLEGVHHESAPKILQLVNQGLNVMMVGPAGCGKTILAETVATALTRKLTIVSCSAGMSEAQLLGRLLPIGEGGKFSYVESPFMRAYANGGVILLDEMDAADANLLLVINAALANGGITVEARAASHDETYVKRHPDTIIMAATNTWGSGADTQYIGRGALDVSSLDRFYRVAVDYDATLETKLGNTKTVVWVQRTRDKARSAKLRRVVSTRMISRIEKAVAAGISFGEATSDELASWTADERAKVA